MAGKPDYYGPPIPEKSGAKRSFPEDIAQTSQKTPKANSGESQDEASQSTSDESVTPEIQVRTQNTEVARGGFLCAPSHGYSSHWACFSARPARRPSNYSSGSYFHVYYPTDRLHAHPPANVTLATLPRYISHIDDLKVRDLLAISVVRHKDIHDMVQYEYERTTLERQSQENEDASVLSFYKEHLEVQKILYGEYDDFVNPVKQEIVHRAFGSINETIMTIPSRVRPRSNWRTKFNAFLILVWIGRGIVDGIGILPNEIRIQMAVDSRLVEAIEHVYETMSEEEILDDGVRLMEALVDLNNDRGACFDGIDSVVKMFKEVMRQGRNVVV
ncbi:hypothetical protein E4T47_03381 [Aureobasidium subglaciale]|nr:hypothetical protein E4T47_03381 [Aureobasidium subglaciale]